VTPPTPSPTAAVESSAPPAPRGPAPDEAGALEAAPAALATRSPQPAPGFPSAPALTLDCLYHRWKGPKPPVLDDVSLALHAGEVAWIGGRNGVGKTTLLRLAAGILLPQRGSVRMGRLTPTDKGGRYQRRIGFLSAGDRGLHARMRVRQQLDYWARLAYVPRARRAELVADALERFGLRELAEQRVDRMSMGQRQRIRLAMAFLHGPRVLLLDEPRNSLDDDGYRLLGEQIERALREGAAVLWCSPRGEDRVLACDVAYTLEGGRLERVR
jgi:ABC-type multidrug transport system ATPase subunit